MLDRVYLSAPLVTEGDIEAVVSAMRSGWVAPAGPALRDFETAMAAYIGVDHAVGLSSGTAVLHLGLKYMGVSPGDLVLVPTVTFAATAFAVLYLGAVPLFVDIDPVYGTIDPSLVAAALDQASGEGRRVAAAIPVDLYGTPVDYESLGSVLKDASVPILEDAAEGLGASHGTRRVGSFGDAAALSFNGNKILTTSGGGMLLTNDATLAEKIGKWSTQSREPVPWYEHHEVGYNYRLSNLLAALGASQLKRIDEIVAHRRQVRSWYSEGLQELAEVRVLGDPPWGVSNAWLTVVDFGDESNDAPERIRVALEERNVESRPVWKPMHQQPVFGSAPTMLNGSADRLFAQGLCLPSGPIMTSSRVDMVCEVVRSVLTA